MPRFVNLHPGIPSSAVWAVTKRAGMSAKKVRRYIHLIKGKPALQAMDALRFLPSPAAQALLETLKSAVANAENNREMDARDLVVVDAYANDGPMLKRYRPQARGRVNPIRRRTCHITVVVDEVVHPQS